MVRDPGQGFNLQEAMQFIQSPAGQQLMELIRSSNDPALQKAKEQAAGGQLDAAKEALQHLADNEELKRLLSQFGG